MARVVEGDDENACGREDAVELAEGGLDLFGGVEVVEGRVRDHDVERAVRVRERPHVGGFRLEVRIAVARGGDDGGRDVDPRDVGPERPQRRVEAASHGLVEQIGLEDTAPFNVGEPAPQQGSVGLVAVGAKRAIAARPAPRRDSRVPLLLHQRGSATTGANFPRPSPSSRS
jgi:hypothetical protein